MVNEDIKMGLKSLCMSHGWCYAVFWHFDPLNPMMLTMEDGYSMEHAGCVVSTMLLQVHSLGEGVIGGAAVDGKHRWMSADDISWDVSEFGLQFSSGIKTIAVLPVESRGVLQLGSIREIYETQEVVDQLKKILEESLGVVTPPVISAATGQNEVFASMSSSQNIFSGDVSTSWVNTVDDVGSCSVFDLLDAQFGSYDGKTGDDNGDSEFLGDPSFASLIKNTQDLFDEQFAATDFPPPSIGFQMDDVTQWLADSSELCAMLSDNPPHTSGDDGVSSIVSGNDGFFSIQGNEPACSLQSSLGNELNNCGEDEILGMNAINDPLLAEFWTENVIGGVGHTHNVSEVGGHSGAAPKKGLFSELGLEHLLRHDKGAVSGSSSKSYVDDQWPPSKRRRLEGYELINDLIQHTPLYPCVGGQFRDFETLTNRVPKSETGLHVRESYGMDTKSCISTVNSQTRKPDESAKPAKKRAKPGESKKPRPKDRQQIAERINELRDLVPNGAKLSIDALLSQTIKHMDYLQNMTKHVDKIKQVHEPKLIGQGMGTLPNSTHGATWAYEVGSSNIVCPIIVEDLGHPGQMLIEMLCEERGYFLEMADIVKGFGLTILKGVMEERNGKIWAQFTVEAKRGVERVHVFMSLMQNMQGGSSKEVATTIEPRKVINNVSPLWTNYQPHGLPISI
ncbi:transcription factor bHLH157 [Silene latifolia]|uniref:transcription factor bHLH157 n=1 Tax=Silene latifolia TaxID=37657 RepID=UPI003D7730CA